MVREHKTRSAQKRRKKCGSSVAYKTMCPPSHRAWPGASELAEALDLAVDAVALDLQLHILVGQALELLIQRPQFIGGAELNGLARAVDLVDPPLLGLVLRREGGLQGLEVLIVLQPRGLAKRVQEVQVLRPDALVLQLRGRGGGVWDGAGVARVLLKRGGGAGDPELLEVLKNFLA